MTDHLVPDDLTARCMELVREAFTREMVVVVGPGYDALAARLGRMMAAGLVDAGGGPYAAAYLGLRAAAREGERE